MAGADRLRPETLKHVAVPLEVMLRHVDLVAKYVDATLGWDEGKSVSLLGAWARGEASVDDEASRADYARLLEALRALLCQERDPGGIVGQVMGAMHEEVVALRKRSTRRPRSTASVRRSGPTFQTR